MSTQSETDLNRVPWTGFGSFAFVVYLVVAVTYGASQTAYALAHEGIGSATYSVVELPLVLAVLLGLLATWRSAAGAGPPLLELALGTAAGYLVYVGVLAAIALPFFDLPAIVRTPSANVAAGVGVVFTAVLVAAASHHFEFADQRDGSADVETESGQQ